ncbi:hypothetical protein M501DRAFT_996076 [Patellaria atrata CBS 101060]|uniref:Aminoacyl-transfer RNA synthetases class-II family profile domain-containing protein n=1 Tax=Patellaria atrata CBS 101060 TaxID=1346257 RepID=A0A9P4S8E2_9PEZI|nr:hypothetical protein M501DRAFT_996076 [Patellaria atrata CBS 101060]
MLCGGISSSALSRASSVWNTYAEISRYARSIGLVKGIPGRSRANAKYFFQNSSSKCRQFLSSAKSLSLEGSQYAFLKNYRETFHFSSPTLEVKDLPNSQVGDGVVLHGYLGKRSDLSKKLSFVTLLSKDLSHSTQVISIRNPERNHVHERLKSLNVHTPVVIKGILKARQDPKDKRIIDGVKPVLGVEVELRDIQCLNEFPSDIAIEDTIIPPQQRHLQIRTDHTIRDALVFRARTAAICREFLGRLGESLLEVETPLLFKSTPEGAREFLVPTRTKGHAYALPQSPQQYKQILMASGIPGYYQIARCFRDEDQRADRQPEFTQLDLEISFADGKKVMDLIERLLASLWQEQLGITIDTPFQRMSYEEAMSRYGSDKPDLRFGMEISRIEHLLPVDLISKIGPLTDPIVEVFKLHVSENARETARFITEFMDSSQSAPFQSNPDGQPGIFIYDPRKPLSGLQAFGFEAAERVEEDLDLIDGDLVVIQARKREPLSGGSTPLGNLRLAIHKAAVVKGLIPVPEGFKLLWVTDFPLFSPANDTDPGQGGGAGLSSTHHPFTSPASAEDIDLLLTDPSKVKAEHYDIVVNGVELGGGSRRIHDVKVQEFILRDVLRMTDERIEDFRHLLEVLRAGCPPHAGIALGFDRLIAVMLGKETVRDVIAFPKSGKGEDLLVKSPNKVTTEQLKTYHLELKE